MASFDVNWVLDFLRRNGFVETEAALREDLSVMWGNAPLGCESLPGLTPVVVGSRSRNQGDLNDIESDGSGDSELFTSARNFDRFCFSSEWGSVNEVSPADLAKWTDSYDSGTDFITAYTSSVPSDLECDKFFESLEFHRDFAKHNDQRQIGLDEEEIDEECSVGGPSVDKFRSTQEVSGLFQSFRQEKETYNYLSASFTAPELHNTLPLENDMEKSCNVVPRTLPFHFRCNPPCDYRDTSSLHQQECVDSSGTFLRTHLTKVMDFSLLENGSSVNEKLQQLHDLYLEEGKSIKAYDGLELLARPYDYKSLTGNQQHSSNIHTTGKLNKAAWPSPVENDITNSASAIIEEVGVGFQLSSPRSLEEIVGAKGNNSPRSSLHIRVFEERFSAEASDVVEVEDGDRDTEGCEYPGTHINEDLQESPLENQMYENFDDDYETFELRVVHPRNRTGFESSKDVPITLNTVIAGRYYVTNDLGSATFSHVVQACDIRTGVDVCLKIIKNNKDYFDQSLDEIMLLKLVNRCDAADKSHVVRLYDYFYHKEHLFIVCELLKANLYEFQKFNQESVADTYFTYPRLQAIAKQCLEALEFLHGLGIIHCDIKPENILVKSYRNCEVKIIDLGSSCFQTDNLCSYVQSRSYRAPEVILGYLYDAKIDIWSLGCVLVELFTGHVLFPNVSLPMLLARIIGTLGPIDVKMIEMGQKSHMYFTDSFDLYHLSQDTNQIEIIQPEESSLQNLLADADIQFVEFIHSLLYINPDIRPTAREALEHPWLSHPYEP